MQILLLFIHTFFMYVQPLLEEPAEGVEEGPPEWVSYFKPNLTINLVDDFTRCPYANSFIDPNASYFLPI